ncbi:lytic transglycosylase domain-containing protein [Candidatus Competibacter phosphatis]|uniref:lytic transglycosylase domain-containing protein n=1 Tax=Candidatus Competibacter phosphatis TaxID=221280 RepID=UPI0030B98E72
MRGLLDHFNEDVTLTLASYNAGEGKVVRYGGIPPYRKTQQDEGTGHPSPLKGQSCRKRSG